ncbi:Precorrin-6Y C(5,15)-methyltransferase (decarboxylating) [Candidatus Terasakiella magnetica]|uniref:Precorrin-6Y C(5,15)-methyltransferase (Decarboxylating) n=1 Tax=Candidatus Terasakiella magnetica TaxID=1867952 RepID=A0A1C3RJC9_9PROT|nr:bifunctional cobalt-precorrin-7 (C(5))-methyltransferase/cobalt-precorrin-6B (C(15))-methyltransferase [Candidatus Terasakiella magnetica]SCA57361.1 Precorrin-6Y C(5,15)-methyltransferase (decarboxylating) [Candidatus Terasakiella magnetica]
MIHIIGIGEDGLEALSSSLKELISNADILVGGVRHLEIVESEARKISWGVGLSKGIDEIKANREKGVVVLATGEPMWFGIGATLLKHFEPSEVMVHPTCGAFSLVAGRMGWAIADCVTMTIHGRPLENLNRYVANGAKILVLSRDGKSPIEVADLLAKYGYGDSHITVFEHMGGKAEKRLEGTATGWTAKTADLNTIAIECIGAHDARRLPQTCGLEDDLFEHDGQLTKREVRAVTLSTLAPQAGELLWDVGAGCGSIAIEWMRAHEKCHAIAIEQNDHRRSMIAHNGAALGVPNLEIVDAKAPEGLEGLPTPDAIFIGGGISKKGLLETCWAALPCGGRLVANTVTLEAEREMLHFADKIGARLTRIAISREESVGRLSALKPMAPVLQLFAIKE